MTVLTKVWNYTGAVQTFVVPANVTSIRFELWGASGGNAQGYGVQTGFTDSAAATSAATGKLAKAELNNGSGYVAGTLAVTPGQALSIYVGGNGYNGSPTDYSDGVSHTSATVKGGLGGYNGGGKGGQAVFNSITNSRSSEASGGGGGGGATDIRSGGTALANRILVAAGAGGMGGGLHSAWQSEYWGSNQNQTLTGNPGTPNPPYSTITYYASGAGRGGWGGPATGANGGNAASHSASGGGGTTSNTGGKGGSATAGGAGGVAGLSGGVAGSAGALGVGGAGGIGTQTSSNSGVSMGGGGGGGGYYGGGGGAVGADEMTSSYPGFGGGGGGGSNYVSPSMVSPVTIAHAYPPAAAGASGNGGFARATYTQPPNAPTILSPTTGQVVSFDRSVDIDYQFSSPDTSAFATAIDVQWKKSSDSTWTLQHVISGDIGTYTFPANLFSPGFTYNVQVRIYDNNNDPSAWTQIDLVVITPPPTPVITAPAVDASVSTNTFNVTWTQSSGSSELSYHVRILKRDGTSILYDSGEVPANSRVNLALTPGFEFGTQAWTVVGGTIAQSTTYHHTGANSGKITWGNSSVAQASTPIATQVGKTYNVAARVALGTIATDPQITIAAADSNGAIFEVGDTSVATVAGTFVVITLSFVARQATTWIVFTPGDGTVTSGKLTYLDSIIAELNSGSPRPYFDGGNANGQTGSVSWAGTAGNSQSRLTTADVLTHSVNWSGSSEPVTLEVLYSTIASQGADSNPASRNFTINVAPPGVPTVVMTADDDTGSISFAIHAVDTPAVTAFYDIFRRDVTHGEEEIRIATNVAPDPVTRNVTFVDRSAGTNTLYAYRIRAYSAQLGYAEVA